MTTVLYDATFASYFDGRFIGGGVAPIGLVFLILRLILLRFWRQIAPFVSGPLSPKLLPYGFIVMGGGFSIAVLYSMVLLPSYFRTEISSGKAKTIQGPVIYYQPWIQHSSPANLEVKNETFTYWANIRQGLIDSASPISFRSGEVVRLTLVDGAIVKAESIP